MVLRDLTDFWAAATPPPGIEQVICGSKIKETPAGVLKSLVHPFFYKGTLLLMALRKKLAVNY